MKNRNLIIITATATIACTGAVLHIAHGHAIGVLPGNLAAHAATTQFPGTATPETALQSLAWAAAKGDMNLLRAGVTPDIQKMMDNGGPKFAAHAIGVATELGRGKILQKESVSDGEVVLYVQTEESTNPRELVMQKTDDGWKLAALKP